MKRDLIPETPHFHDELERLLRSLAEAPERSPVPRRRRAIALALALVLTLVVIALLSDRRPGKLVTGADTRSSATTATAVPRTGTTSTPQSQPTTPPTTAATAVVPGRRGGAPPCAAPLGGRYGASVSHPERAPLQAAETFGGGVRWAVCGADTVFSAEVLNLRSTDDGGTWSVNSTLISISPFHAGDAVDVHFSDASHAEIHVVSLVGERDDHYLTEDGGRTWHSTR